MQFRQVLSKGIAFQKRIAQRKCYSDKDSLKVMYFDKDCPKVMKFKQGLSKGNVT